MFDTFSAELRAGLTALVLLFALDSQSAFAAERTTHLGVEPSEMITLLTADLSDPNGALVRVFPDLSFTGGVDDTFIVPEGKVFVITDIEVELLDTAAKAGFTAGATLVVSYPAGVGRAPWYGRTTLGTQGDGYISAHFTSGIAVGPGIEVNLIVSGGPGPFHINAHSSVQGYLLDE